VRAEIGKKVDWAHIIFNSLCSELDSGISMLRRIRGIRMIHVGLPWYWQKSFRFVCASKGKPLKPLILSTIPFLIKRKQNHSFEPSHLQYNNKNCRKTCSLL
jgi:hypothetical protein